MKKVLASCLVSASILLANNSIELNLNNDTMEASGEVYLNNHYSFSNNSDYFFNLTYLDTENSITEIDERYLSTGLKVLNPFNDENGFSFGVGIKVVLVGSNFRSVPLSLYGKYDINEAMYIDAAYSYAPDVLTYDQGKNYNDLKAKFNYRILEDGYIYAGVRKIEANYNDSSLPNEYNDSMFFGYKVRF